MRVVGKATCEVPAWNAVPFFPRFTKIWDGSESRGRQFETWSDFRALWRELPRTELDALLAYLYDKFCTFGYVGLQHRDGFMEKKDGQSLLLLLQTTDVAEWPERGLALATLFWLFDSAAILVTEYNQQLLEIAEIRRFLVRKRDGYRLLDTVVPPAAGDSLLSLGEQIQQLRASIPSHYVRSFSINGMTWEREERYLDGHKAANIVYPVVGDEIRNHLGIALPEGETVKERFQQLVDILTAHHVNPFQILVAIANAAVKDEALTADFAVVTVPQGRSLGRLWDTEDKDVCSYATIRPGFDYAEQGVEFNDAQIRRAIERRMRFNASCRSKNYHPVREVRRKAQPFQFPDIAFGESSHHQGHIKAGIRNSARTHFEIRIPSLSEYGEFRGFGDFRVNRATDEVTRRYSFEELEHLLPYGLWCKTVFDHVIGHGLFMDLKYCVSDS